MGGRLPGWWEGATSGYMRVDARQVFGDPTSREFAPGRIALDAPGGVVGVMEWRAIWLACAATSVMTTGIPM